VLAYLGRDQKDQAKELAAYGSPVMGCINFDSDVDTPEDRRETALYWDSLIRARQSNRLKQNPLYHVALNWQEGEHPTHDQAMEACEHVMKALGFQECEAIWAIHRDTDNDHIHLVINRIHPDSPHKHIEKPFKDYFLLDKAMRELELKQGWAHSNGPYIALVGEHGTEIVRMSRKEREALGLLQNPNAARLTRSAEAAEHRLGGMESFQRWVSEVPSLAIKDILAKPMPSWAKVHEALANLGLNIQPKGSGMVLTTTLENGRVLAAKASQMGRWASMAALEKALGEYSPSAVVTGAASAYELHITANRRSMTNDQPKQAQAAQPPNDDRAKRRAEREEARAQLSDRFKHGQDKLFVDRQAKRLQLKESQALARKELSLEHRGKRIQARAAAKLNGISSVVAISLWAFKAAAEREALQKQQSIDRKALTQKIPRSEVWRTWLEQQAAAGDEAALSALRGIRYREQREKKQKVDGIEGEDLEPLKKLTLTGLQARIDRKRREVSYIGLDGLTKFIDSGQRIEMRDKAPDSLEAALRIASQKYGGKIELTGSAEFRERAARMAVKMGIQVVDKDLQVIVQHEREKTTPTQYKKMPIGIVKGKGIAR
jgi:hypothetical protein